MKTDPIEDHITAVTFQGITDPVKRTKFFRTNRDAIMREQARVRAGKPLPQAAQTFSATAKAEPFPWGLTLKRGGKVISHVPIKTVTQPTGGIFGNR